VKRIATCVLAAAAVVLGCGGSEAPEQATPAVVSVLGTGKEQATGFAVGQERVVTVAHALAGGAAVRVRAGRAARRARVVRVDARADLALLAVPRLRGAPLRTAPASDDDRVGVAVLRGGDIVTVAASVRRAIDAHVSAPGAERAQRRPALELDVRLRAGDSGAPVLTEDGDLAGVLFARSRDRADTAYAVDASAVQALIVGSPSPSTKTEG
jgi:S1-C subfamily serine protease